MRGLRQKYFKQKYSIQPLYSYWQAVYRSFFSKALYKDVAKNWQGFGFVYLLFLLFIMVSPIAIHMSSQVGSMFKTEVVDIFNQLPLLYIKDGKISSSSPAPHLLKDKTGTTVAMVYTSPAITGMDSVEKSYPNLKVLVTGDKIFFRLPYPEISLDYTKAQNYRTTTLFYPLSLKKDERVFSGKEWVHSFYPQAMKYFFQFFMYPIFVLSLFFLYLPLFFLFSVIGSFLAKIACRYDLSYRQASRLLIVSATPTFILCFFFFLFGWNIEPLAWPLLIFWIVYFFGAIVALKGEQRKLVKV